MLRAFLLLIPFLFATENGSFTDKDLNDLLKDSYANNKRIVIYTWSPHMSLSEKGLSELLQFKWDFTPVFLLDPNSSVKFARAVAEKNHWPDSVLTVNRSSNLIKRGMRVHYPSYEFIFLGKLKSPVVPGYKLPAEIHRLEKRYFK